MDNLKKYSGFLNEALNLPKLVNVVFDSSNGVAGLVLENLKNKKLNSEIINKAIDGNFPAHGPNPMASKAMNQLKKAVLEKEADLGVIFDADGDRAFFVDDSGREVPADAVLFLLSSNFSGPVVANVLAGYLAKDLFKKSKKKIIESRVGHYFIKKIMKAKKAKFGGEFSGHYYFPLGNSYFDSGILAAVYFINEVSKMKKSGIKLSDWVNDLPAYFSSGELNFEIDDKDKSMMSAEKKYSKSAKRISKIDGLKMEFADWWFVMRPSHTENLLRLVVEAKSSKVLSDRLAELRLLL